MEPPESPVKEKEKRNRSSRGRSVSPDAELAAQSQLQTTSLVPHPPATLSPHAHSQQPTGRSVSPSLRDRNEAKKDKKEKQISNEAERAMSPLHRRMNFYFLRVTLVTFDSVASP